jgi:paired amphipathic helix protein Sin3a
MRELRVEDALLYLDQVKVEFGDRPHIYNEFLDIMKTFKTQQIDTPGVIRRVSNLFQGNRRLVLGFNTFLPEGYKIELPLDGDGPPVAVFRAPGSSVTHVLSSSGPGPQATAAMGQHHEQQRLQQQREQQQRDKQQQQQQQQQQSGPPGAAARAGMPPHAQAPGPPPPTGRRGPPPQGTQQSQQQQQHQQQQHSRDSSQGEMPTMPTQHSQAGGPGGPAPARGQQSQQQQMQQSQQQQQPPQGMPRDGAARAQYPMESQQQPARGGGPGLGGPPPHHSAAEAAASQAPRQPQAPAPAPGRPQEGSAANVAAQRMAAPNAMGSMPPAAAAQQPQQHSPPTQQQQPPAPAARSPEVHQPAPLEFDHAINYVTTIKKRFSSEPETYKRFLEILHTYQKEQRGIKEVLDEVSTLFADHPDLLKEFTYFLPDAVQGQAKAQLDQVAKESEARKRTQAKQAIMTTAQGMQRQAQGLTRAPASASRGPEYERSTAPVPFGATQGRSLDRERDIIRGAHFGVVSFAPVRPPKRNESTPAQAAAKKGRPTAIPELPRLPNTTETVFFQRAKDHLNRKELAADKAPGSRRHTPYTEFIKCLHLFGSGILNKDELVLLLRGLFMQGHAPKSGANAGGGVSNPSVANDAGELLRELEEILVGRGPYADQENALKDKSKYGGLRARDFDLSNCETPTPSYRTYPTDFPQSLFLSNPGQTESDAANLNKTLICVGPEKNTKKRLPRSLEAYDGVRMRHNMYEESLFRIEDERYEVDMAIERNAQAMRQIEPFAEEVQALREQEEKDGQPIGRLQYQLNRYALNSVHINAIGRLFGEYGDEVLQHLCRNPIIVLPIVYERLKQKDTEWRKAKEDLTEKWNAGFIANYEGSKDVLCYPYRRELERNFAPKLLLEECKRARIHCKHPEKIRDHPATRNFTPTFSPGSSDRGSLLFQPYLQVGAKVDISHKDAFNFVVRQLTSTSKVSPLDRERIGRIWAEFIVPWFGYPLHWVRDEVRSSFRGKLTPAVVKSKSNISSYAYTFYFIPCAHIGSSIFL